MEAMEYNDTEKVMGYLRKLFFNQDILCNRNCKLSYVLTIYNLKPTATVTFCTHVSSKERKPCKWNLQVRLSSKSSFPNMKTTSSQIKS